MTNTKNKRLLILGGTSASLDLVKNARKLGLYTIVTDNNTTGVAKEIADETAMVSTADIDALVELCKERLGWSRTTTYTIIRRLTDRGVVKSENAIVSSVIKKEEVQLREMNELMEKTFEGSLPAFIAAFAKRQKLSQEDMEALRLLIEQGG